MAVVLDKIRATAERVAASHGMDVVDLELTGGGKHRALRVFLEKNAEERGKLAALAAVALAQASDPGIEGQVSLPQGVPAEALSGITHEDCELFARDFGTVADVEDLVPGAEYTLEVSSPGLERKLLKAADYSRFLGFLVKLQTFTPVDGNRQFTGRLTSFDGLRLTLDLAAIQQKGKAARKTTQASPLVDLELANVEKAHLVAEI
jgi:ribosome maturation factor RimP